MPKALFSPATRQPPRESISACIQSCSSGFKGVYIKLGPVAKIIQSERVASRWLVENKPYIDEQLTIATTQWRQCRRSALPRAQNTVDQPRIYLVMLDCLHREGLSQSLPTLKRFFKEHQAAPELQLAELWAIPLMLRIALLDVLHQAAQNLVMPDDGERAPHVQAQVEMLVASLTTLRRIDTWNWEQFVEEVSIVNAVLKTDPAAVFDAMDFESRNVYRHAVESLATRYAISQSAVAKAAIALASSCNAPSGEAMKHGHVGFFLLGDGLAKLKVHLAGGTPWHQSLLEQLAARRLFIYLGCITAASLAITASMTNSLVDEKLGLFVQCCLWLATLTISFHCAISVSNWLVMAAIKPKRLPRMDYSSGIPADHQCLVVVPSMLMSCSSVDVLVRALEIRFLANRDPYVFFALLSDFMDAKDKDAMGDAAVLLHARQQLSALNLRYPAKHGQRFSLMHRPRHWNAQEKVWMGLERKRGKLAALNALICGGGPEHFQVLDCDLASLQQTRFVLTLDSDTTLPLETVAQLVGTLAHPLNRAVLDHDSKKVTAGYGILQPRLMSHPEAGLRSPYARLNSAEMGIDPYTGASSDVYQDAFQQGSFFGKGLYDVAVMQSVIGAKLANNQILSHDLLEGCYARSGLVSDVVLFEDQPSHYFDDVARRHRWIRGDWQLWRWIGPWIHSATGASVPNPLSGLSRWKLFDNLRRSVVPLGVMAALIGGWAWSESPGLWTCLILGMVVAPSLIRTCEHVWRKPWTTAWSVHLQESFRLQGRQLGQLGFSLACLPYEVQYTLDAILRTIARLAFTRRNLLQWTPSEVSRFSDESVGSRRRVWQQMAIGPATALALLALLAWWQASALLAALPVLLLWLLAPEIVILTGTKTSRPSETLDPHELQFLGALARRTWHHFYILWAATDQWLPPDNVQGNVVAHRTSPTNIGLGLLANLAAFDLGYETLDGVILRCTKTLDTVEKLQRCHGHLLNWYDTQTLEPIEPAFVSTVDSGNLLGHLITLRAGLRALLGADGISPRWVRGLRESLDVVSSTLPPSSTGMITAFRQLLPGSLAGERVDGTPDPELLGLLHVFAKEIKGHAASLRRGRSVDELGSLEWTTGLMAQCASLVLAASQNTAQHRAIRDSSIELLIFRIDALLEVDHRFLYDAERRLQRIGRLGKDDGADDRASYDLLASEARLGLFVAIAQGQLPKQSWCALGRPLVKSAGEPIVLSWSGSMFEYLMPLLVMPQWPGTLLEKTYAGVVREQIRYANAHGLPWGISESAYNTKNAESEYQYGAFGLPLLGLKQGLGDDMVVAPYASALALLVQPREACCNLQRLAAEGMMGRFGLYEAIDYTAARRLGNGQGAIVQCFMAHHQAMMLLSLSHVLAGPLMQQRFASDPMCAAALLLLQEKVPSRRSKSDCES